MYPTYCYPNATLYSYVILHVFDLHFQEAFSYILQYPSKTIDSLHCVLIRGIAEMKDYTQCQIIPKNGR